MSQRSDCCGVREADFKKNVNKPEQKSSEKEINKDDSVINEIFNTVSEKQEKVAELIGRLGELNKKFDYKETIENELEPYSKTSDSYQEPLQEEYGSEENIDKDELRKIIENELKDVKGTTECVGIKKDDFENIENEKGKAVKSVKAQPVEELGQGGDICRYLGLKIVKSAVEFENILGEYLEIQSCILKKILQCGPDRRMLDLIHLLNQNLEKVCCIESCIIEKLEKGLKIVDCPVVK